MQIPFRKVLTYKNDIDYDDETLSFKGSIEKTDTHEVNLEGTLRAKPALLCNRCGAGYEVDFEEKIRLNLTDKPVSVDDLDTIECLEGTIDIGAILHSEVEALNSDYNYCPECQNDEEFEVEL